ncbi:MAG: single-stranded-DNA-specific exonuclease RecJ [Gemmatimonadota bacterium]|nr:single-stranded-DNA-specific exonuclease RecJ [Gemmatimonadota bacterium]
MTRSTASRPSTVRSPAAVWHAPPEPDPRAVRTLQAALRLPEPVCRVLAVRGLSDPEAAKRFLRPRLEHLHDPALLADGPRAAERIAEAVRAGEVILVHGDYDVDGICATALLTRWLRGLGGRVVPFVPHRLRDGYDFSEAGLEAARHADATLILTADCGTVAHDTVAAAAREGRDVVVTDHHTVGEAPSPAYAVVNPKRPDCPYPDEGLSGTGLAYRVCELVGRALDEDLEPLARYLDLVALATVADLVPLSGENRVLVAYGLKRMARTTLPGLAALLDASGTAADELTAGKLGFVVAPRINAAGRIGDADDALRLLLTDEPEEARALATALEEINRDRRLEDRRTEEEAFAELEQTYDPDRDYAVVLAADGWHPGIIGIVASRVVERIHRPVVMVALDGARGRGSARSVPGFHLYEALKACSEHLERFGGHRQAAGMDVLRDRVPALREALNAEARARMEENDLRPALRPDLALDPASVDLELVHWLTYLGPHGIGNPGPLFRTDGVRLEGSREVGHGHLKTVLTRDETRVEAIGFGLFARCPSETLAADGHDVLYRLEKNEWRGRATAQAKLVDVRPAGAST